MLNGWAMVTIVVMVTRQWAEIRMFVLAGWLLQQQWHMAVISLSQLRQRRRRRFNWRLPVPEKAAGGQSCLSFRRYRCLLRLPSFLSTSLPAFHTFIALLCSFYVWMFIFVSGGPSSLRKCLSTSSHPRTCTRFTCRYLRGSANRLPWKEFLWQHNR